ncbi:MAG: MptD family putative ECF transporter S component [Lachnospiraceae bacterium]|nr:MptD family putative ECF transporter S component [Lachnospiraceae bacterium]
MNKRLEVKDLINIGIYTALHFLCVFIIAMLGFIPQVLIFAGIIEGFIGAIPLMLFLTKTKKPGMLTIMGILLGVITVIMGRPWQSILFAAGAGIISDIVWKLGNYKSPKAAVVCCGTMMLWMGAMGLPLFFSFRDNYLASLEEGYGPDYVEVIRSLTPDWMFFVMILIAVVGGILGGLFAKRLLHKHFEKAGMTE